MDPSKKAYASRLYTCWGNFAQQNGEHPGTATAFGIRLVERGFQKTKSGTTVYVGISPKSGGPKELFAKL